MNYSDWCLSQSMVTEVSELLFDPKGVLLRKEKT